MSLQTALLFIVFNRPGPTERVFAAIRAARPKKLYIAADGPRADRQGEEQLCQAVRNLVTQGIDWPCETHFLFRHKNVGCKVGVSSAIDWFFAREERGIILEDDTLPHPSFFPFCEELLERYADDTRVGMISGDNFQSGRRRSEASYYFSRNTHIWGWATWRRVWKLYDADMRLFSAMQKDGALNDILVDQGLVRHWTDIFAKVYRGEIDTWDYELTFGFWIHQLLAILPAINMVSNIGFGPEATHTTGASKFAELPALEMKFPLVHPNFILRDTLQDSISDVDVFGVTLEGGAAQRATQFLQSSRLTPAVQEYVISMIQSAVEIFQRGDLQGTLQLLQEIKQTGFAVQNVDYLKGLCLFNLHDLGGAQSALREEIQRFPQSQEARTLLAECDRRLK